MRPSFPFGRKLLDTCIDSDQCLSSYFRIDRFLLCISIFLSSFYVYVFCFFLCVFLSLALCYFVLVFFSPFSIAITSHWEERAHLSVFRTFAGFALDWFCLFLFALRVWDGLRLVIVALPGLFSNLFLYTPFSDIDHALGK